MPDKITTLAETGEREYIRTIRELMPGDGGLGGIIVRSVGDDCLVTEPPVGGHVLSTIDTFVENVHFRRDFAGFDHIGRRCMVASVSDIAAMAGTPSFSLVSLSMPKTMKTHDAVGLFRGLQDAALEYGCPVAGGETTSTGGPVTVTVTVIGVSGQSGTVFRSGAQPGDGIYVTGTPGDAMAGLIAVERRETGFGRLTEKFLTPAALVIHARELVARYPVTSMIDISDGLAVDLGHICEESGCGAEIVEELIPLSDEYRLFAEKTGLDTTVFALSSGEEFELLFTSGDRSMPGLFHLVDRPVTRIGTIVEQSGGMTIRRKNDRKEPLFSYGYEHFT